MRVHFFENVTDIIRSYRLGYPEKAMIPHNHNYYELKIDMKTMGSIERESEITTWLYVNIGKFQVNWDMYVIPKHRTEVDHAINEDIFHRFIRFRYKNDAIHYKMIWA